MEFLIILLLLILNGVFAMYEIALVSSCKARLETLVGKGNKRAKGVLKQLEEPEKFLSTIQIGITLIGIVSGAYGGVAIADDLVPLFSLIPGAEAYARNLAMVTTVAIITYHLRVGSQVHRSQQSGKVCNLIQPYYDSADKSILSFCLATQYLHPTTEQAYRLEKRRTSDDAGRDKDDSPPKFGTGGD